MRYLVVLRVAEREPAVYGVGGPLDVAALLRPPRWHAAALCRDPAYAGLRWFPDVGGDTTATKAVCARCTVRLECLHAGLGEPAGIWGGMSRRARQRLRLTAA